jgi:hypothetical protein
VGEVIPFQRRVTGRGEPDPAVDARECEALVRAGVRAGCEARGILEAAKPLMAHARDRYGFAVMADGLPLDPDALAHALISLSRGLSLLVLDIPRRPLVTIGVYFGHADFSWFEDGYGEESGLAVPNAIVPEAFAAFVRTRLNRQAISQGG